MLIKNPAWGQPLVGTQCILVPSWSQKIYLLQEALPDDSQGVFCSLKQSPQALPWDATCFNPIPLVTLARPHISKGQIVARPSALGVGWGPGQEACLNEKIIDPQRYESSHMC